MFGNDGIKIFSFKPVSIGMFLGENNVAWRHHPQFPPQIPLFLYRSRMMNIIGGFEGKRPCNGSASGY